MKRDGRSTTLVDVEHENVMVSAAHVAAARARIQAGARDETEAAMFADMLGIGEQPAWHMGGAA